MTAFRMGLTHRHANHESILKSGVSEESPSFGIDAVKDRLGCRIAM